MMYTSRCRQQPVVLNDDDNIIPSFRRFPGGAQTHILMITSAIFLLGTAHYRRRIAVILHSILHNMEAGWNKYFTTYFKLWKTEGINTALRPSIFVRRSAVILLSVLKIL